MTHVWWILYLIGQGMHVVKRASSSAASSISGTKTIVQFLKLNWLALTIRLALMCASVSYLSGHPDVLDKLLDKVGFQPDFELPFTNATAIIYGYFGDSIFDWALSKIPLLQKEVPAVKISAS